MDIKDIDYGMAFRIKDTVYLNKNLNKYPKLYKAILEHEKEHTDNFSFRDVMIDVTGKHLSKVKKDYYMFFVRHPQALAQFLPLLKVNNKWSIDPVMFFLWGYIIIFILATMFIIVL